jgi:hypothetical protein
VVSMALIEYSGTPASVAACEIICVSSKLE